MTDSDSTGYYQRREAHERQFADTAANPAAAAIHRELADRYAALVRGERDSADQRATWVMAEADAVEAGNAGQPLTRDPTIENPPRIGFDMSSL